MARATARQRLGLAAAATALTIGGLAVVDRVAGCFVVAPPRIALGFPPNATAGFRTSEFAFELHVNALGIRDEEVEVPRRDRQRARIAVLGDSFTFGWGVEQAEAWPEVVEDALRAEGRDVEVVDLGRPGAGPVDYADFAESALPLLEPDLVVVALLEGDDLAQAAKAQRFDTPVVTAGPALDRVVGVMWRLYPTTFGVLERSADVSFPADQVRTVMAMQAARVAGRFRGAQRERYEALPAAFVERFRDGDLNPYILAMAVEEPDRFLGLGDPGAATTRERIADVSAALRRIRAAAGATPVTLLQVPMSHYVSESGNRVARELGFRLDPDALTGSGVDESMIRAANDAGLPLAVFTAEFRAAARERPLFLPVDSHFDREGQALFAELATPLVRAALP